MFLKHDTELLGTALTTPGFIDPQCPSAVPLDCRQMSEADGHDGQVQWGIWTMDIEDRLLMIAHSSLL